MGRHYLMPEQQESESAAVPGPAPGGRVSGSIQDSSMQPTNLTPSPTNTPQRIPYWLQQAERFLRVIVRIYLGLLVCFAPWYPPAWDSNPLFSQSPGLMHFITHGAVRGVVSGLGLLNLWIALRDAMHNPAERDR
jgi:NhaP-type Na+/H+ or K+/H+ antiporter